MARVLVIDDDPGMRDFLQETLAAAGHEIFCAANGREGVALFRAHPAELVISDMLMPEQEGIETIQQLRALHLPIKVIAMSGAPVGWKVLQMAEKIGANATLQKPFETDELLRVVERLLHGTQS
jgi:two-component system, chemotaxis family, chemotaxis protein CheY